MRTIFGSFLFLFSLILTGSFFSTVILAQTQGLLYESDLTYAGSFKMPDGNYGMADGTCEYSNGQVAGTVYNDPSRGKCIFITGYLSAGYVSSTPSVAQVTIPALKSAASGISALNSGSVVQGFADPSNGKGGQALSGSGSGSTALVCYGDKMIGTMNSAYDAACAQTKSAWVTPINFADKSQATGPYTFTSPVGPRFLGGGYMTLIPQEWQTALGGKVVSGNGPWSIIGCGSPGPALHVIDADLLITQPASTTSIPSTALVYYQDGDRSSLGVWNSNDPNQVIDGKQIPSVTVTDPHGRGTFTIAYEDNSMKVSGVLFAEGTRSVLFFGRKGLGDYCYGTGSECGDPESDSKGDHCYPYTEFVWAYDVNDLVAAKNGQKNPWDVLPYTGWIPVLPSDDEGGSVGVAWDPETRIAYLVQSCVFGNCTPVVHAFSVADKSTPVEEGNTGMNGISITAAPNPFNPAVLISIGVRLAAPLQIKIYDTAGRFITDLTSRIVNGQISWDASAQSSGIYIVRAVVGSRVVTKAITLLK